MNLSPPRVPGSCPTAVRNAVKEICDSELKNMTYHIVAVSSQSSFTEGLAAVQRWKIKHDESTIPSYTNNKVYTDIQCVAKTHDHVS
jgi:hypothetical protein